jgi:hypothetical protein
MALAVMRVRSLFLLLAQRELERLYRSPKKGMPGGAFRYRPRK